MHHQILLKFSAEWQKAHLELQGFSFIRGLITLYSEKSFH
jgi:hypothetical protein